MNKIRVGKYTDVQLKAPGSIAIQLDVITLSVTNPSRAVYAALGVCWTGRGRPKVSYARSQYVAALYGGLVLEELLKRDDGTTPSQVMDAGIVALQLIQAKAGGLYAQEVEETADFTPAAEE
jgi:hypothetical protein